MLRQSVFAIPLFLALGCQPGAVAATPDNCGGAAEECEPERVPDPKWTNVSTPPKVGFQRASFRDEARDRKIIVDFWYRTEDASAVREHRYGLATGNVGEGAIPSEGKYALVLLSHGAGGGGADYAWLSEALASSGSIVAGIHHPGESRAYGESTLDPHALFRVWERAEDVAFVYSEILAQPRWAELLSEGLVNGVGHSAGGHSMLAAAGIEYDVTRLGPYCESDVAKSDLGCAYARDLTDEDRAAIGEPRPLKSAPVPFLKLFLMEPALTPSFSPGGLAAFDTPVLQVASRPGDFLPYEGQAAYLSKNLKNVRESLLENGEGHFTFLSECSLPIRVHGIPLCEDKEGVKRSEVHAKLKREAIHFFKE